MISIISACQISLLSESFFQNSYALRNEISMCFILVIRQIYVNLSYGFGVLAI